MSRYYIYDSVNDTVAEFATSYNANNRKASRYQGKEGGRRARPEGKGLGDAEVRVTGSGQNPIGRAARKMTKGGGLTGYDGGFASDQANSRAFKKMITKRPNKLLLGAGALAAGAGVIGGGYALKKRADRKAQERSSIKGRVKRLLGR
jgi:hypothetical protein